MSVQQQAHRLLPALELGFRERLEEGARDAGAAAHGTEPAGGPFCPQAGQTHDGCRPTRDDDFLSPFRAFDQARELGLGGMDGMRLRHGLCDLS